MGRSFLTAELDELNAAEPDPGNVSWIDLTVTGSAANDKPYSPEDYEYVAVWSAGGWLYLVVGGSPSDRERGVAAVVGAVG